MDRVFFFSMALKARISSLYISFKFPFLNENFLLRFFFLFFFKENVNRKWGWESPSFSPLFFFLFVSFLPFFLLFLSSFLYFFVLRRGNEREMENDFFFFSFLLNSFLWKRGRGETGKNRREFFLVNVNINLHKKWKIKMHVLFHISPQSDLPEKIFFPSDGMKDPLLIWLMNGAAVDQELRLPVLENQIFLPILRMGYLLLW